MKQDLLKTDIAPQPPDEQKRRDQHGRGGKEDNVEGRERGLFER